MQPSTLRTWLWQLSYAIFGFAFLISTFVAVMAWGTGTFWTCIAIAAVSVILLAILNRVFNARRPPSSRAE